MSILQQLRVLVDTYGGNDNLRRAGATVAMTPEQMIEVARCMSDPIYFCKNYAKIVHVDRGLIAFNPYDYQIKIIKSAVDNRYTICKLPRQAGKTTSIAAMICWLLLFNKNYSIACLAHKQDQAIETIDRVKTIYENLPLWLQQGVVRWNTKSIKLENGAQVFAAATTSGTIRGKSINLVYLDEFAIVPDRVQEEFYKSVIPTIGSGITTKIIVTSTPKGFNMFYKLWTEAVEGRNDYNPIEIHWSETPGRDAAWAEAELRALGSQDAFDQEYGTDFLGSSATLIDGRFLKTMTFKQPTKESDNLSLYEDPIKDHNYVLVADVSEGVEKDFSAFVVFDITSEPYQIVATYRNNELNPLAYPDLIARAGKFYNDAYVLVENNGRGAEVLNLLWYELEYENLLGSMFKRESVIADSSRAELGLRQTPKTKAKGCANLKTLVEHNQLIINDFQALYELSRFVRHKNSYQAESGSHDDLVMCCVIFGWLTTQSYFRDLTDTDMRNTLREQVSEHIASEMLLCHIDNGPNSPLEEVQTISGTSFDRWLND